MTMLKKKVWDNLLGALLTFITGIPGIALLVYLNAYGISFFAGGAGALIGSGIALAITYRKIIKTWAKFDERERRIVIKARIISNFIFIYFIFWASFLIFYFVGAKNHLPAYILPILVILGIVLMLLVEAAVIFIQIAKDNLNE